MNNRWAPSLTSWITLGTPPRETNCSTHRCQASTGKKLYRVRMPRVLLLNQIRSTQYKFTEAENMDFFTSFGRENTIDYWQTIWITWESTLRDALALFCKHHARKNLKQISRYKWDQLKYDTTNEQLSDSFNKLKKSAKKAFDGKPISPASTSTVFCLPKYQLTSRMTSTLTTNKILQWKSYATLFNFDINTSKWRSHSNWSRFMKCHLAQKNKALKIHVNELSRSVPNLAGRGSTEIKKRQQFRSFFGLKLKDRDFFHPPPPQDIFFQFLKLSCFTMEHFWLYYPTFFQKWKENLQNSCYLFEIQLDRNSVNVHAGGWVFSKIS